MHTPKGDPQRVTLNVFGAHQVGNALAAAAVGIESGMDAATVAQALSDAHSVSVNRMDVNTRADGVTVINDAYNANPESMRAAIAALGYTAAARPGVRSLAVLGEMGELGAGAEHEHAALADELARYSVTDLITVGNNASMEALAERAEQFGIRTSSVADAAEASEVVRELLAMPPAGIDDWQSRTDRDVVLVKASNVARLWAVAEALLQGHTLR